MITQRIEWSKDEWSRFLMAARFFGPPRRGDTPQIYEAAQRRAQVRMRPFDSATAAKMNKARSTPLSDGSLAKAPDPVPIPPPVVEVREEATAPAAVEASPAELEAEAPTLPGIADLVSDAILRVLYNPAIRVALRELVAEALAPESELEQKQAITWRAPKVGERQLRVVLAGGNFAAYGIKNVTGLDLRLWGQQREDSTHRLRAILQNCDMAIAVTSGIRHAAMWMIKEREKQGRLQAIYWTRPLSELKPELERLAAASRNGG